MLVAGPHRKRCMPLRQVTMTTAKKKLNQYKGRLDPTQIAGGMNAASRNALRLADDAALLLKKGRFASAAALAILSIEESGKNPILRGMAVAKTDAAILECWRHYRSHTTKNPLWILPQLFFQGARRLHDFSEVFDPNAEHPYLLEQLKQISLYTDCLGDAHWSEPGQVINEDLAKMLVQTAQILCSRTEKTAQEIKLWIKHMGPVWGHSTWMDAALENWYAEMQELGLVQEGGNEMKEFIRKGLKRKSGENEDQE